MSLYEQFLADMGNPCECQDYHKGNEHEGRCPRLATGVYGGVWLCTECATAEVED